MLPKQMKEMSNLGLSKVYEDLPEVEEGREIGQTHFSSVKMAVFADKGLCDPLGASAPHHKGYVQRFPGDTRIALRGAPADNVKGELLTPRTAERCPQIQGAPQVPGGGIAGARSAKVFHAAVCLSPQRYQQASPLRSRQHVQQRGPMTASAPCVSHMKPGVVPQAFHQRVAPVYAPHARVPHVAPHAPHPAATCGRQVFVARMPEAFGKSNMMRPCAGGPNRK